MIKSYSKISTSCAWDLVQVEMGEPGSSSIFEQGLRVKHATSFPVFYPYKVLKELVNEDRLHELYGWSSKEDEYLKEKISEFIVDIERRFTYGN